MLISREQTVTISPDVLFQEVSGEIVLLDLASEQYFGLDEVGARVWGLLNEGRSIGELTDTLFQEYEVEKEALESDIEALLSSLLEAGLISIAEPETVVGAE